jgi:hypothetical protein
MNITCFSQPCRASASLAVVVKMAGGAPALQFARSRSALCACHSDGVEFQLELSHADKLGPLREDEMVVSPVK